MYVNGSFSNGSFSFGFGGVGKGRLERGWGRVWEGLGRGLERGWGRGGEGLDFYTSKKPRLKKPLTFPRKLLVSKAPKRHAMWSFLAFLWAFLAEKDRASRGGCFLLRMGCWQRAWIHGPIFTSFTFLRFETAETNHIGGLSFGCFILESFCEQCCG